MKRSLGMVGLSLSVALGGCDSEPGSSFVIADNSIEPDRIACLPIDEGEELDAELGTGAGAFIEYHGSGLWHVFVTCDTDVSNYSCGWDLVAYVDLDHTLEVTDDSEMDDEDTVSRFDEGGVRLLMRTTSDTDGVFFQTGDDASVIFDTLLDGMADPLVYGWVGDGVLHAGGPSNPLELVPPSSDRECP